MLGTPIQTETLSAGCHASQRDAVYCGMGKDAGVVLQGEVLSAMMQGMFGAPSYHLIKQAQGSANSPPLVGHRVKI